MAQLSGADLVERLLHAYFQGDFQTVLECVTDDFTWVNIALPRAIVMGRDALIAKLAVPNLGLPLKLEKAEHETSSVLERPGLVMHERVDRLTFAGEAMEIACAAAFELRDGRIAIWRDYYDIGVVLRFFARHGHPLDTTGWW